VADPGESVAEHPPVALTEAMKALPPAAFAGAASKLVAASVGDVAVVFSRSPAHKHYALADIEWMILPPVAHGQFYVAEAVNKATGFRAPIAVVTWALVSEEVDQRLSADLSHRIRLRPDEWKSGDVAWVVDLAGAPAGMSHALQWLKAGPFKDRDVKVIARDTDGVAGVRMLSELSAPVTIEKRV